MANLNKQYPKLLAFLQLFYPHLYQQLSSHSEKADIVEANLICSNNTQSFQAIIFSEDVAKDGEIFEIYTGNNSVAPYSWDWRWVFAIKLVFSGSPVFAMKFKQKVIALPTGKHPLTNVFFNILEEEFETSIKDILSRSSQEAVSLHESFSEFSKAVSL